MTEHEQAVIQSAMDWEMFRSALDHGVPAQKYVKRAAKKLRKACADLASECEGKWVPPND